MGVYFILVLNIFYTRSKIIGNNGVEMETITFEPVSIHPKYHRKGFGKKLITYSIEKAKKLVYKAIITLGYPYHYEYLGFLGGKKYNISMEDRKFYKGLLVLPLFENALNGISGYVKFSEVYNCKEEEVIEFDNTFPLKEKCFKESQKEFQIASSMIDE